MNLKLSQFTVPVHDYPKAGFHLLYNTLTRAMIKIDDQGWSLLDGLPEIPVGKPVQSWLKALGRDGFVVPEGVNEGELYTQRLEKGKSNTAHLHVTLSLVQNCNFGCSYCYQGGDTTTHNGTKITKAEVDGSINTREIIHFLKSECKARQVKSLVFTAYGGEPLLNKTALLEIVSTMQAHCRKNGIKWGFNMISNGSLLTKKTVLELKEYGFTQVQITIDGNRETHDISRPWKNPKGAEISTYDVIMRNLENWAGLIRTEVLSVVSKDSINATHELIETLAEKGLAEKRVRMSFSPISPTYDDATIADVTQTYTENPALIEAELELDDAITKLIIHAAKRGLVDDLRPTSAWCAVIRANGQNVTITPDGTIYSCALFIGRDAQYETGHITKPERGGMDATMKEFEYPDSCKACTYLPICANCRADALAQTGELLGANSQEQRYDLMLPQLIKTHYDLTASRRN